MRSKWMRTTVAALAGAALTLTLTAPVSTGAPPPKTKVSGAFVDVTGDEDSPCPEAGLVAYAFSGDMDGCWYITDRNADGLVLDPQGNGVQKGTGVILTDRFVGTIHGVEADITFTGEAYGFLRRDFTQITGGCTHEVDGGQDWDGIVYLKDFFGEGNSGTGRYRGTLEHVG